MNICNNERKKERFEKMKLMHLIKQKIYCNYSKPKLVSSSPRIFKDPALQSVYVKTKVGQELEIFVKEKLLVYD